jgi:hypothetical protein
MRKALKIAGLLLGIPLAVVVVREAFFSNTAYFVIVPGAKLYTDGIPASGWLHKSVRGRVLILTRNAGGKSESYWITMPDEKDGWISSCGDWAAPALPLIAIGDVNPPCLAFELAEGPSRSPRPPLRAPTFGPQFVEFTADDGTRVKTSW